MSTGQSQIQLKAGNALDSDSVSNVATNAADTEALSNVDDKDIYPNAVWCKHLFAEDGIIAGLLKAGSILVGSGGVVITSDAAGGEPSTGVYIGSSVIELKKSGAAIITLDGTDGTFDIRSSATGARTQIDASGIVLYNGAGAALVSLLDDGTFAIKSAASGARVLIDGNGIQLIDSADAALVTLDSDGTFDIRSSATGARVQIDGDGVRLFNASDAALVTLGNDGTFDIRSAATGARLQMNGDGIAALNSSSEIGTELTASGVQIYNQTEDNANPTERIDFYDGTKADDTLVGSLHGYIQTATGRYLLRWPKGLKVDENVYANNLDASWTNFDSTVTAGGTMTISSVTKTYARYCDVGPMRYFEVGYTYEVDAGTYDHRIEFTVPDTSISGGASVFGHINVDGGGAKGAWGWFNTDHFEVQRYDNADHTAGASRSIRCHGWYTVA